MPSLLPHGSTVHHGLVMAYMERTLSKVFTDQQTKLEPTDGLSTGPSKYELWAGSFPLSCRPKPCQLLADMTERPVQKYNRQTL